MRRAPFIVLGLLALPFFTLQPAQAADGKLATAVQMHAGPGTEFPSVRRLAKDLTVDIHGCLRTWDWCDVSWRGNRGWVPAAAVDFRQNDQRYPVRQYGPQMGVPEVTFQLSSYWDAHYNSTLWYADRDMWSRLNANYNVQ